MADVNLNAAVSQDVSSNAVGRDQSAHDKALPTIIDYLGYAQKQSGRHPLAMAREYFGLVRGRGKLSLPEYVLYGVYDRDRNSAEAQSRFLTNRLHWPITHVCCDMTWQATTEDKWLCSHILGRSAIRIPETLAVIDKTGRSYPDTSEISTVEQFKSFLRSKDVLPLFGKEMRGMCSYGAFLIEDTSDDAVLLEGEGWIEYAKLFEEFIGDTPYLLQRLEKNHAFYDRYTPHLATIRLCILMGKDGVKIPFAVQKMPSRHNVADSFWRPGNIACNLDVETGEFLTVRTKNEFGTKDHETHPDTGAPLLGETVPMWDQVLDMANACAPIFAPVRYQSMDVAVTQDGPVLIEINTGGGFDLPQFASGEGFLTDDVIAFFKACGYDKI